jgi:hypothetical protein
MAVRRLFLTFMTSSMGGGRAAALLTVLALLAPFRLLAQAPPAAPQSAPPNAPAPSQAAAPAAQPVAEGKIERFDFGFRLRVFPAKRFSVMGSDEYRSTTTPPLYDWNFNTTTRSPIGGGGLAFEIHASRRSTLRAEVLYQRLSYDKVVDIYWGTDDSTTTTDERTHMARTERSKGRVFDVPVMWQVGRFREEGLLARLYLAAGATVRNINTIRTNLTTVFPNTSTTTDLTHVQPSRRNLVGAVVGLGFRFIDDYNIKTTPEIRYPRWAGQTFGSDSTRSPRNQIEFGIGFTF